MISDNTENERSSILNSARKADPSKARTKASVGMVTPKSQARPVSAKSASKSLASPRALFSDMSSNSVYGKEAAKLAKLQSTADRIKKVAFLKEKWAKEREINNQINKEKKTADLKKLQDENDAAAAARKKALDAEKTYESLEKQREKDLLAASLQDRNQLAKDLETQAKAKRRISVFLNSKLRNAALQKEAEMEVKKQQELVQELADRRTDYLQVRQARAREEQNRRESMANRGLTAQKQREAEAEMAKQAAEEEAALLTTRKLNWEDDHKAKLAAEQQRRMSMAGRLDHWRDQKQVEKAEKQDEFNATKDLLSTRRLDHQDMQKYKSDLVQRDRMSLAGRLQKWREDKEDPGVKAAAEAIERELQEQAYEDVKNYKTKQEHSRRESLAYRLEKARKDRTFEAGQHALAQIVEEEERRIEEEDRAAVEKYRKDLMEARRQSLQYRLTVESNDRIRREGEKHAQKEAMREEIAKRQEDWQAVKEYQQSLREQQRRSLAGRIAEAQRIKELDLQRHQEMLNAAHLDFHLRRLDHLEMREYRDEERVRGRRSIALRLASWKEDKMRKEKERAREEMQHAEDALQREQDREELHAAKLALSMMERHNLLTSEMKN